MISVKVEYLDLDAARLDIETGSSVLDSGLEDIAKKGISSMLEVFSVSPSAAYSGCAHTDDVEIFIGDRLEASGKFRLSDLIGSIEAHSYLGESAVFIDLAQRLESMAKDLRKKAESEL